MQNDLCLELGIKRPSTKNSSAQISGDYLLNKTELHLGRGILLKWPTGSFPLTEGYLPQLEIKFCRQSTFVCKKLVIRYTDWTIKNQQACRLRALSSPGRKLLKFQRTQRNGSVSDLRWQDVICQNRNNKRQAMTPYPIFNSLQHIIVCKHNFLYSGKFWPTWFIWRNKVEQSTHTNYKNIRRRVSANQYTLETH